MQEFDILKWTKLHVDSRSDVDIPLFILGFGFRRHDFYWFPYFIEMQQLPVRLFPINCIVIVNVNMIIVKCGIRIYHTLGFRLLPVDEQETCQKYITSRRGNLLRT